MNNHVFIASLLLLSSGSGLAQNSLTFYDADNTRMGTLVRPVASETQIIELMTEDGYLMQIGTDLGVVMSSSETSTLWYTTEDCTGTVYLEANSNWLKYRGGDQLTQGGQLLIIGPTIDGLLARIPWGASTSIDAASTINLFEPLCGQLDSLKNIPEAVAITNPHPSVYGMKYIDPGFWGYVPPFTAYVEEPDLISCSGFESCPTTN